MLPGAQNLLSGQSLQMMPTRNMMCSSKLVYEGRTGPCVDAAFVERISEWDRKIFKVLTYRGRS